MTDPYRPFPATTTAQFDRTRLERAGVPAETVDELERAFPDLSDEERAEFAQFVTSNSDAAIAARYSEGMPPAPPAAPTEESLMAETVDDLEGRIRTWNADHEDDPEAHLAVSGRKVDLVSRLLDAYGAEQGDDGQADATLPPAPDGATGTVAAQVVPTAPVPTATDGAPTGTQTPDAAGAGATTTTGGTP